VTAAESRTDCCVNWKELDCGEIGKLSAGCSSVVWPRPLQKVISATALNASRGLWSGPSKDKVDTLFYLALVVSEIFVKTTIVGRDAVVA